MIRTRTSEEQASAAVVVGHMATVQGLIAGFPVAVPSSVDVGRRDALLCLWGETLTRVAVGLLSWAEVLTEVTADVRRASDDLVVSINGRGMTGLAVRVFAGAPFDAAVFGEMEPNAQRSVTLEELRTWAAGAVTEGVTGDELA